MRTISKTVFFTLLVEMSVFHVCSCGSQELEQSRQRNMELKEELQEAHLHIGRLQGELGATRIEAERRQKECDERLTQIATLREELRSSKLAITELERLNQEMNANRSLLKKELERYRDEDDANARAAAGVRRRALQYQETLGQA